MESYLSFHSYSVWYLIWFIYYSLINVFLYYISTQEVMKNYPKTILCSYFWLLFNLVVIGALSISHYSITVNVHHICKKKLSCTFTGYFVLCILCWLSYFRLPITNSTMIALTILAFLNYFTFITSVLSTLSETLHIDVFGTKFKTD